MSHNDDFSDELGERGVCCVTQGGVWLNAQEGGSLRCGSGIVFSVVRIFICQELLQYISIASLTY